MGLEGVACQEPGSAPTLSVVEVLRMVVSLLREGGFGALRLMERL